MFELVNTSLPNGLLPGTHGFATVAMTRGLADNLRRRLEDLSAYVHKTSAHDATYTTLNPVAWSHLILPRGEHVLGRVSAAPFDYTGRTNRLARLVCLTAAEAKSFNAAETLLRENAYFSAPWEGEARWLEPDAARTARFGAASVRASRKSQAWIDAFGELDGSRYAAGFAALLRDSIRQNGKPLTFVTSQQSDPDGRRALAFIADLIALLPEDLQPSATFSTYPCAIPIGVKCAIRVLRKDDNGYAQAVAGVPVADFGAKTVQNANLLPHDAELEHLAATGNLPEPVAPVKAAPQTATAQQSVTVKVATDEAIDVSIHLPSATGSDEAITVTEKDASHRKPKLKQRSGQSAPMPVQGQQFDPLFGQSRKQSNGPLIVAVAVSAVLLLGLAAFVVLQLSQQNTNRSKSVVAETKQEKTIESEVTAPSTTEVRKVISEGAVANPAEHVAKVPRPPSVTDTTNTDEIVPLYSDISKIIPCLNDAEAKEKFGHPPKTGLSSGDVWCYAGTFAKVAQKFSFTKDDSGKSKCWDIRDDPSATFDLIIVKGLPSEKNTPFFRIWHFDTKPDVIYCVTNTSPTTTLLRSTKQPINLVELFWGPDKRISETVRGKCTYKAFAGDGRSNVSWQTIRDVYAFDSASFIADCLRLRNSQLQNQLAAVQAKHPRLTELQARTNDLATAIVQLKKASPTLASLSNAVITAWSKYQEANKKYNSIKTELEKIRREKVAAAQSKEAAERKQRGASLNPKANAALQTEIENWGKKEDAYTSDAEKKQKEMEKVDVGGLKQEYETAKRNLDEKKRKLEGYEIERNIARDEIDSILDAERKAKAALNALPSVDEALRQWTIHVKVNLGEGK